MLTDLEHHVINYLRSSRVEEQDAFQMGQDIAKMVWLWLMRPDIEYHSIWDVVDLINDYEEARKQ
jgi:hypothetical protein